MIGKHGTTAANYHDSTISVESGPRKISSKCASDQCFEIP